MPVYNYAGYFDPSVSVYAFDAFIDFDASLLEYEGCEKNPAFKAFHTSFAPELADMPSKRKLVISAFQTSTSLVPLNGFFRYFTLTFRMNATAEPGPATTGIDVYFSGIYNVGLNRMSIAHYASLYDYEVTNDNGQGWFFCRWYSTPPCNPVNSHKITQLAQDSSWTDDVWPNYSPKLYVHYAPPPG